MNSRERVLKAMNHQEPDRIPIDFSAHRSSGISALAYPKLRDFLGLKPTVVKVYDPVQQLAVLDEDILNRFGVDVIELGRAFDKEEHLWVDWVLPDGTPCKMPYWAEPKRAENSWNIQSQKTNRVIARMPDGVIYFEQTYWPFAEKENLDDIAGAFNESMWCALPSPPGPLTAGPDGHKLLADRAGELRANTDKAIVALFGGNLLEMGEFLYGIDVFMMMLASERKRAEKFLDKLLELYLSNLEIFLNAVGDSIDVILFGDDMGGQRGPLISPTMYEQIFKPRHKILWNRAKELADVKTLLHCCGGVRQLIPHFIDIGLDAINPVQISCEGMAPQALKNEYGKYITFWGGGCDTRDVLPNGTPDEVYKHVQELLRIWTPGGGFVFQQVHNILANVSPENIVAMLDAVHHYSE
jgi:uroporphyrinogen decarboxylase